MGKKKKSREQVAAEREQEILDWEDYLLLDLKERILKNGGRALSERQLKKTTNGDATYERMVRVVGRGSPDRLRQVMLKMVQEIQGVRSNSERSEEKGAIPEVGKHSEEAKHFEKTEDFEPEKHSEESEYFEANEPPKDETSREVSQLAEKPKRQKWDKASLLVFLRGKCQELGRVPTSTQIAEWSKEKLCPSYPTCMKLLEVNSKAEWKAILLGEDAA